MLFILVLKAEFSSLKVVSSDTCPVSILKMLEVFGLIFLKK